MMTYGATTMTGWVFGWMMIELTTLLLGALGILILIAFVLFKLNRAGMPRHRPAAEQSKDLLLQRHERGLLSEKQYRDAEHVRKDEAHP